jgi:hypothetical protein
MSPYHRWTRCKRLSPAPSAQSSAGAAVATSIEQIMGAPAPGRDRDHPAYALEQSAAYDVQWLKRSCAELTKHADLGYVGDEVLGPYCERRAPTEGGAGAGAAQPARWLSWRARRMRVAPLRLRGACASARLQRLAQRVRKGAREGAQCAIARALDSGCMCS